MSFLAICAILKNEATYVHEWLSFHHAIGVERFLLFDNGSTDNTVDVIRAWPHSDCVTLVDWPEVPGQLTAYSHAMTAYRDIARWCAFIDGDEFLVPQTDMSVPDVLRYFDPICTGLYVNWHMFGSSGIKERQAGLVTETYRKRGRSDFGPNAIGKTIVRMAHAVAVNGPHIITTDGRLINDGEILIEQSIEAITVAPSHNFIAINHYFTKSEAEWRQRRSFGKADKAKHEADYRRTLDEFNRHDVNDIEDDIAANIMTFAAARYGHPRATTRIAIPEPEPEPEPAPTMTMDDGTAAVLTNFVDAMEGFGVDPASVEVVVDLGARDALQSVAFATRFPAARVIAIECNPATVPLCEYNIRLFGNITLVRKAVNLHSGLCQFMVIDPTKTVTTWPDGNPGASSLFSANGTYPTETYVQRSVEVACTRLDDLCQEHRIRAIDILWMDIQGAELIALKSAGAVLDRVRIIHLEASHRPIYDGQCLFSDIDAFLTGRGFQRKTEVHSHLWQEDVVYVNSRDLIDVVVPVGPHDIETARIAVAAIHQHVVDVRNIYILSEHEMAFETPTIAIPEADFAFSKVDVDGILDLGARSSWYYQQLLKMYVSRVNPRLLRRYLVVDADTFFLRPIRFVEGVRSVFAIGGEFHQPYFDHMARLHPDLVKNICHSGIAHCMTFDRNRLEGLIRKVEVFHNGQAFWKIFLTATTPEDRAHSGASEYEIYFNYMIRYFPHEIAMPTIIWGNISTAKEIDVDEFHYVSFHWWKRGGINLSDVEKKIRTLQVEI